MKTRVKIIISFILAISLYTFIASYLGWQSETRGGWQTGYYEWLVKKVEIKLDKWF